MYIVVQLTPKKQMDTKYQFSTAHVSFDLITLILCVPGYYAEHISPYAEARNSTMFRVKTDSKGIHLHNLSYAGPIVMGCGGKCNFNCRYNVLRTTSVELLFYCYHSHFSAL